MILQTWIFFIAIFWKFILNLPSGPLAGGPCPLFWQKLQHKYHLVRPMGKWSHHQHQGCEWVNPWRQSFLIQPRLPPDVFVPLPRWWRWPWRLVFGDGGDDYGKGYSTPVLQLWFTKGIWLTYTPLIVSMIYKIPMYTPTHLHPPTKSPQTPNNLGKTTMATTSLNGHCPDRSYLPPSPPWGNEQRGPVFWTSITTF